MCDQLFNAAQKFNILMEREYHFLLGRKGKSKTVKLNFCAENFFHLVGIHKLNDINQSKLRAKEFFFKALAKKITLEDLGKSSKINTIMDRLYIVENLDLILAQNNEYFQFREKVILNSKINWDLLIEFCTDEFEGYLFLDEYRRNKGTFFCCSCFSKDRNDYAFKQIRWTLLKVEYIQNGIELPIQVYKSKSYKE
ncbi:PBECR4 domain-containing protein [Enterococcus faecalis]|uniref:PBECR4 domain-containing protein n=1 Tax=Enterococcus faecalis TaxID=1351 RepID=UPI0021E72599|nr:PBECR4 domain-containing protein [Enterococcus faecalis]MCV3154042.1 PBECR4 domain-containing protein [Enterococcus faecalis]